MSDGAPESWTVALDDFLVGRLQHCLVCGRACTSETVWGVWELDPQRAVSYVAHPRCWDHAAARRVLGPRYDPTTRR